MMKAAMPLLLLSLLVSAVPAVHVRQLEAAAAAPHVQRVQMALANYGGDIHGARALAAVSFERLYNYVAMSGQIRSGQFLYTFRAELVGYSGFGEIVSHVEGTRFQIKIDLTPTGFALTSNPFGPGMLTTYYFKRN
jgi:hypothetical protein